MLHVTARSALTAPRTPQQCSHWLSLLLLCNPALAIAAAVVAAGAETVQRVLGHRAPSAAAPSPWRPHLPLPPDLATPAPARQTDNLSVMLHRVGEERGHRLGSVEGMQSAQAHTLRNTNLCPARPQLQSTLARCTHRYPVSSGER